MFSAIILVSLGWMACKYRDKIGAFIGGVIEDVEKKLSE